jgi:hypothetical protein
MRIFWPYKLVIEGVSISGRYSPPVSISNFKSSNVRSIVRPLGTRGAEDVAVIEAVAFVVGFAEPAFSTAAGVFESEPAVAYQTPIASAATTMIAKASTPRIRPLDR